MISNPKKANISSSQYQYRYRFETLHNQETQHLKITFINYTKQYQQIIRIRITISYLNSQLSNLGIKVYIVGRTLKSASRLVDLLRAQQSNLASSKFESTLAKTITAVNNFRSGLDMLEIGQIGLYFPITMALEPKTLAIVEERWCYIVCRVLSLFGVYDVIVLRSRGTGISDDVCLTLI